MAWLEQCEVCGGGGGGLFCCHRSSRPHADLNQVAGAAACPHEGGGPSGFVQEFQFFGRPGEEMAWLLGGDGEGLAEERGTPPVAPAAWDLDGRWPALDDGGCSVSAGPKNPLAEAGVAGSAACSADGAALQVPYFFGGGADDPHGDATEAADKAPASSSGKDDGGGGMDREARVLRYREKKKRRKFGKQIRYASRKAYAEARPRIRGRFVKAPDAEGVASSPQPPPPPPLLPPQYYDAEHRIGLGFLRAFRP